MIYRYLHDCILKALTCTCHGILSYYTFASAPIIKVNVCPSEAYLHISFFLSNTTSLFLLIVVFVI
jgi:hypothetical protein